MQEFNFINFFYWFLSIDESSWKNQTFLSNRHYYYNVMNSALWYRSKWKSEFKCALIRGLLGLLGLGQWGIHSDCYSSILIDFIEFGLTSFVFEVLWVFPHERDTKVCRVNIVVRRKEHQLFSYICGKMLLLPLTWEGDFSCTRHCVFRWPAGKDHWSTIHTNSQGELHGVSLTGFCLHTCNVTCKL